MKLVDLTELPEYYDNWLETLEVYSNNKSTYLEQMIEKALRKPQISQLTIR